MVINNKLEFAVVLSFSELTTGTQSFAVLLNMLTNMIAQLTQLG